MRSIKETKYLFVARGPGEAGQARAVAKFISQKGGQILFACQQENNLSWLANDKEFKVFVTETPEKLIQAVNNEKPEVVLIFNSKMWGRQEGFSEKNPFNYSPLVFCIDSNWLFNEKKYPYFYIKWAQKYLILFPRNIFELGLKQNGGDFVISSDIQDRVIPVGFVPSYLKPSAQQIKKIRDKYGILPGEKFIFSYFSGLGAGHRIFAFNNLVSAIDSLIKKGRKIKVLYIGPTDDLDQKKLKKSWLATVNELPSDSYFLTLASSDLVFQHQGMVSLAQAISAQVPVICNIRFSKEERLPRIHLWEVGPFERAKACKMFFKSTPIKEIGKSIEKFLYDRKAIKKMKNIQKNILKNGEEEIFDIISKELKKAAKNI